MSIRALLLTISTLFGCAELPPAEVPDAGIDAGADAAVYRAPPWRETECAVLCDPARAVALCEGGDQWRCASQCYAMRPYPDYCPPTVVQW